MEPAVAPLIFITGGVRSGKSHFAEALTKQLCELTHQLVYIATGVAFDDEMARRIAHHQQLRAGEGWQTIEHPTNFSTLPPHIPDNAVVLWDCATTWLGNECYDDNAWQDQARLQARIEAMKEALWTLRKRGIPLVIVSNEMLDSPVPHYDEARVYTQTLGELHQWFVAEATIAIEMEYGYKKIWKGADVCENYFS